MTDPDLPTERLRPDPPPPPPVPIRLAKRNAGWRRPTLSPSERELLRLLVLQHAQVASANMGDDLLTDQQREVYRSRHTLCLRLLGKLGDG